MNDKLKAGDTYKANGNVYRVYDDGQRLRLWLISQPKQEKRVLRREWGDVENYGPGVWEKVSKEFGGE